MALLKVELRNRRYFAVCCFVLMLALAFFTRSNGGLLCLYVELLYTCLPMILCGMMYGNNDEIDLIISNKRSTVSCFAVKWLSIYMLAMGIALITLWGMSLFTQKSIMDHMWIALSLGVTLTFFMAVAALLRILVRNAYISVTFLLFMIVAFALNHDAIRKNLRPAFFIYFDPYISDFFVATPTWLANRGILLGLAACLLAGCALLLRKDKLYNSEAN